MKSNHPRSRPAEARRHPRDLRDLPPAPDAARRVVGGTLLEAAAKGKVHKTVQIHGTA
jgi:hypothetical protein